MYRWEWVPHQSTCTCVSLILSSINFNDVLTQSWMFTSAPAATRNCTMSSDINWYLTIPTGRGIEEFLLVLCKETGHVLLICE